MQGRSKWRGQPSAGPAGSFCYNESVHWLDSVPGQGL